MKPREQKQREAQARQVERNNRTDAEQLSRLTQAGHGHCKEADRLLKQISKERAA